jgi:single-strand DNA-binding protein
MASLNKVLLMGNLTRDPELRYIPNGSAVASFTVACNRTYKLPSGEKKEEVSFIRVVVWGKTAENCSEYLKKGSGVFVEGRLQSRSWEAQDGTKRSMTEVVALNVQFLGRSGGGRQDSGESYAGQASKEPLDEISLDMPMEAASGKPEGDEDVVPF